MTGPCSDDTTGWFTNEYNGRSEQQVSGLRKEIGPLKSEMRGLKGI
ncbi:MAG: hypothetical protein IKN41_09845 [Candidatus Methanomethylophilaceae archaeon]|nr:hypothetical protein [Candidatus Methanomethylophilaceae archaeon]